MKSNTKKITKSRLKDIIREEIDNFLLDDENDSEMDDEIDSEMDDEDLAEEIDILTGAPISKKQARQNKTPQTHLDRLGLKPEPLARLANGVISENKEELKAKCRAIGFRSFEDILRSMDAMKKAADGKLGD